MSAAISANSWNPLEKWWGSVPSCLYGWFAEGCYWVLPLHPTFQKSQKGSILNSHINCSCPVEDPASILYASHIRKACAEGTLLLIWHNDHTVHSSWKQWWSKGLYISLAVLSIQQVSLNRCPHSELSYSTNYSSSGTWLVICHFLYNSLFIHLHYCLLQPLMMLIWVKRFWLHCGEKSKVGLMILHSLVSIIVPF
jgi:hypothetical protein